MGIGLDFGTTNSSLAFASASGAVQLAQFPVAGGLATESFRSLLYLQKATEQGRAVIHSWSGPQGIEHYLAADDETGRLVQSLKSFLASRGLKSTEVFGRRFQLEELVARMVRDIRVGAEGHFGASIERAVVGRPVRFVGASSKEDDEYALSRLEEALYKAGFEEVSFELEPIAAAYFYESTLDHEELILIGDFGGGTSDFSLIRVGPSQRKLSGPQRSVLGNEGLGLAGDAFDAKIIRYLVSPELGANTEIRSGDKLLPVPSWVYRKLERWHHLSFLKSQETLNLLQSVSRQALEPERIDHLRYLIQHDLGYHLHRAVQQVKVALSAEDNTIFHFVDGDVELRARVSRSQFEHWISEELQAIERTVQVLLSHSGVSPADVDMVFLTGGTSLVPAVRRIFEEQFGSGKISAGDEFTSVARGLALKSLESL